MQNAKKIGQEVLITEALGQITRVYEEVYVMKIKKTRDAVLRNRYFVDSLTQVFAGIKELYGAALLKDPAALKARLAGNKKAVAVLLSANKKFSGELTPKVFSSFYKHIQKSSDEVVVVGKAGRSLLTQQGWKKPYQFFDLPDDPALLKLVDSYATVNVFYGRFVSLINQTDSKLVIKEIDYSHLAKGSPSGFREQNFIFEPSLPAVVHFFEKELFAAFFRQASQEFSLASLGSSISQLEAAVNNAEERLIKLKQTQRRLARVAENRRRQSVLPSIVFSWE